MGSRWRRAIRAASPATVLALTAEGQKVFEGTAERYRAAGAMRHEVRADCVPRGDEADYGQPTTRSSCCSSINGAVPGHQSFSCRRPFYDWLREWEAEVRHRWTTVARGREVRWQDQADVVRRSTGAISDAAWLRQQFTADHDIMRDVHYAMRMLSRRPLISTLAVVVLAIGIGGTVAVSPSSTPCFFGNCRIETPSGS